MDDLSAIKEKYPLWELVDSILGPPVQSTKQWARWRCPFHDDNSPSFVVYANSQRCSCEAGCKIAGRVWGDVFDFVREYYHLPNIASAVRELQGKTLTPVFRELPEEHERKLSWYDVKNLLLYQEEALPFYRKRGLTEQTVRDYRFGLYTDWPFHPEDMEKTYVKRYAMPDIAYNQVRNIELRRDDGDAIERLGSLDQQVVSRYCDAYKTRNSSFPSTEDLLDHYFGAKYLRVPGGIRRNLIFNAERALKKITHEGVTGWFSPDMPYLLVHEGALKALVLDQAGYPSVSAKGASGLAYLYGVKELVIIQDNEPDKKRRDGTSFNAGLEYATRAAEASGRRHGIRIIKPPDGYKGADDAVNAGVADAWLAKEGIYPVHG